VGRGRRMRGRGCGAIGRRIICRCLKMEGDMQRRWWI
jgi:hypothetical protein